MVVPKHYLDSMIQRAVQSVPVKKRKKPIIILYKIMKISLLNHYFKIAPVIIDFRNKN